MSETTSILLIRHGQSQGNARVQVVNDTRHLAGL